MILDDEALACRLKQRRHDLAAAARRFGLAALLRERDIVGDVGTRLTTDAERVRIDPAAVARAAAARATEALRCVEEYGKIVSSEAAASIEAIRYDVYEIEQQLFVIAPRFHRLCEARLHVLMTADLCLGDWLTVAEAALSGGADVIQLREKRLPDRELLTRAEKLRETTRRHGALLIINDRPDIAVLVDADGVHLGRDDLPIEAARRIVGPHRIIGASTHGVDEVTHALASGADYLGVGPMFASRTKPDVPVNGPEILCAASDRIARASDESSVEPRAANVPLVAIGGISPDNVASLVTALARGSLLGFAQSQNSFDDGDQSEARRRPCFAVAVSQAVIASADPRRAVEQIRQAMHSDG